MDTKSAKFIEENWALLLHPNKKEFEAALSRTPLHHLQRILTLLQSENHLTLEQIASQTGLSRNTIATIIRIVDGRLLDCFPYPKNRSQKAVQLIPRADLQPSDTKTPSLRENQQVTKGKKFIAHLPESKHFRSITPESSKFVWEDKSIEKSSGTSRLRIYSPVPDPWQQNPQWTVLFQFSQGKSAFQYTNRLDFRLFEPTVEDHQTLPKATICREIWKGRIAHSTSPTLMFAAFEIVPPPGGELKELPWWLMVSVIEDSVK